MKVVNGITYEIVGDAVNIAEEHTVAISEHTRRCWAFVEAYGGCGYRPCRHSGIRSIFFDLPSAPSGFRKIGSHQGKIECRPDKRIKRGKEAISDLAEIDRPPSGNDIARHFGWDTSSFVISGTTIYFPTFLDVTHPNKRYFLRLPRKADDEWQCPETLAELLGSQFIAAIEEHNREARRQNEDAS